MLAARIVDLVISRFLLRLARHTTTDMDDQLVQLMHRPVFVSVILVGLNIAVKILAFSEGYPLVHCCLLVAGRRASAVSQLQVPSRHPVRATSFSMKAAS